MAFDKIYPNRKDWIPSRKMRHVPSQEEREYYIHNNGKCRKCRCSYCVNGRRRYLKNKDIDHEN